ncbi:Glycosyltransferase, DXD sugar-binding motif [Dillenia turbinata]|uniref:Glycosyltransferase, DXD sugar-binding motif n=1 Tax=Dillenia turbinata TaxID=194707 RepID=A0AAN8VLY7_9MAGN
MLRSPPPRPQSRCGAQACAIFAALLLILSVLVLHSRLTRHPNANSHLRRQNDALYAPDDPFSNFFVDDTDPNDVVSFNKPNRDDRIDELDIVEEEEKVSNEEEILRSVENEDDDSDKSRVSGFYWDHINEVFRRAFDKRSIDQWEEAESSNFDLGFLVDDKSRAALGSDDEPVDEDVKRKVSEVEVLEDALLMKTPKRVSPLREGWGSWFDAKSDFLRRDRMFKSNMEILNPLNNPILQDPDGVGVTGLTRGDKIVQKWLFNEFKRTPFLGKKLLATSEKSHESNLVQNGENAGNRKVNGDLKEIQMVNLDGRAKVKRMEQRTLRENVATSDSGNIRMANVASEKNSNGRIKSEKTGHVYANGRNWGYYPGLYPRLTFSDFMNAFFRKGDCTLRLFMVWNSPPWMFTVRYQRSLESLLLHHKDACVVVFSETIELDFFKDLVNDGYKIGVAMPNLDELLKDTPTHVFASVWHEWRKTNYYSIHYSELIRLAALYKYGGVYLDFDVIVLKPLLSLNNSLGAEDHLTDSPLNGAVMAFRNHSPFIMECLAEFYTTYDDTSLTWNGAELLTRVAKRFLSKKNSSKEMLELKVRPASLFFPISSHDITRYFIAPAGDIERSQQDILLKNILKESFTFHFWNSITAALVPEEGSLAARLIDHFCIHCSDLL